MNDFNKTGDSGDYKFYGGEAYAAAARTDQYENLIILITLITLTTGRNTMKCTPLRIFAPIIATSTTVRTRPFHFDDFTTYQ
jgi:hypothetical protein